MKKSIINTATNFNSTPMSLRDTLYPEGGVAGARQTTLEYLHIEGILKTHELRHQRFHQVTSVVGGRCHHSWDVYLQAMVTNQQTTTHHQARATSNITPITGEASVSTCEEVQCWSGLCNDSAGVKTVAPIENRRACQCSPGLPCACRGPRAWSPGIAAL